MRKIQLHRAETETISNVPQVTAPGTKMMHPPWVAEEGMLSTENFEGRKVHHYLRRDQWWNMKELKFS
jgi:hypothetical protein